MTSVNLLQTCFVSTCANALFRRDGYPLNIHTAAVVARRTTRCSPQSLLAPRHRHRSRRSCVSPASPYRRQRTSFSIYSPNAPRKTPLSLTLPRLVHGRIEAAFRASRIMKEIGLSMDGALLPPAPASTAVPASAPAPAPQPRPHQGGRQGGHDVVEPRCAPKSTPVSSVPASPAPSQADDFTETRSMRSASTTSRSTNRLSLTLPIAPPTAYPSRPTPASSTVPSFPPTPLDTPSLMSPSGPGEFITAIATQERRVLELREDLNRAEAELVRLKKLWATHEAYKKKAEGRNAEPPRVLGASADLRDEPAARRSIEVDRKKALLLGQQTQCIPDKGRRRVFRGGHARTLSLLSPVRPTADGFPVHDDASSGSRPRFEDHDLAYPTKYSPITPGLPTKRASWAPRSTTQTTAVKQIAQDLRHGLWTFMEDLRQATVGDEPITGQGTYLRGNDGNMRAALNNMAGSQSNSAGDQETIRASGANSRPRVTSAFDESSATGTRPVAAHGQSQEKDSESAPTTRPSRTLSRSSTESKTTKRFSWTPLTIDAYDDNDWSNWDSPNASSPRWSGTTVNGDIIPTIPEKRDENDTPL